MCPKSNDPSDQGIELHTHQLSREGTVGVAGPWIPPHCHLPPLEMLDMMADQSMEVVCTCQSIAKQTLENIVHRL
jgi:hypothetical protein